MSYNVMTHPFHFAHFDEPDPLDRLRQPGLPGHVGGRDLARPTLLGLQEGDPNSGLTAGLTEYEWLHADTPIPIGVTRDEFAVTGTGIDQVGWHRGDSWWDRYVTWAALTHRATGRSLLMLNTHLQPFQQPRYVRVRAQQVAELARVISRLNPTGDIPLLLTGDFNAPNDAPAGRDAHVRLLGKVGVRDAATLAARDVSRVKRASSHNVMGYAVDGRWHYRALRPFGVHVDYVWVGRGVRVAEWQVVTGPRTVVRRVGARTMRFFDDGPIPSDHNPVVATVEIGG